MKLIVDQLFHSMINILIMIITGWVSYLLYLVVSSFFSFSVSMGTLNIMVSQPVFWMIIFLLCSAVILLEIGMNFIFINFFDYPPNLIRRFVKVSNNLFIYSLWKGNLLKKSLRIIN